MPNVCRLHFILIRSRVAIITTRIHSNPLCVVLVRRKTDPIPGPALDRLTGAAKTYHPNDQMCVLCQFLVQRTQLDMAQYVCLCVIVFPVCFAGSHLFVLVFCLIACSFNAVGQFNGAKTAGAGGAANAATGGSNAGEKGGDDAFIQLGSSEEAEDWEAADAEDAQLMEIAAKQELAESEGDWDAVAALEQQAKAITSDSDEEEEESDEEESEESEEEAPKAASLSETSATVNTGLSALEQSEMAEVLNEMNDDKVADSVQAQIASGMKHTPVMVETGASADSDEEDMIETEVTADSVSNGERKSFLNAVCVRVLTLFILLLSFVVCHSLTPLSVMIVCCGGGVTTVGREIRFRIGFIGRRISRSGRGCHHLRGRRGWRLVPDTVLQRRWQFGIVH